MRAQVVVLVLAMMGPMAWAASTKKPATGKKTATTSPADAGVPEPDAGPVNSDPCARNATCNGCVTFMTASCGWCVDKGMCVLADEGACGASSMATEPTRCPPPGGPRTPIQRADSMVGAQSQNRALPPGERGMPDDAFDQLLERLKEESNDQGRLNLLHEAAKTHGFTVAQLLAVTDTFDVTNGKLSAVEALRDRLVDKKNIPKLYERFKAEPDKKRAQKIMEGAAR